MGGEDGRTKLGFINSFFFFFQLDPKLAEIYFKNSIFQKLHNESKHAVMSLQDLQMGGEGGNLSVHPPGHTTEGSCCNRTLTTSVQGTEEGPQLPPGRRDSFSNTSSKKLL